MSSTSCTRCGQVVERNMTQPAPVHAPSSRPVAPAAAAAGGPGGGVDSGGRPLDGERHTFKFHPPNHLHHRGVRLGKVGKGKLTLTTNLKRKDVKADLPKPGFESRAGGYQCMLVIE